MCLYALPFAFRSSIIGGVSPIVRKYVLFFLVTQWVRTERQLRLFLKGLAFPAACVAVAVLVESVVGASVKLLAGGANATTKAAE
jgi:hypothetical protein